MSKQHPAEPPYIDIALDKPRRLLYDFNALIALGEALDENMLERDAWDRVLGIERDPKNFEKIISSRTIKPRNLRALLWSGLLSDDTDNWTKAAKLTIEQAGTLLSFAKIGTVMDAISRAQAVQADQIEGVDEKRPTVAAASGQ